MSAVIRMKRRVDEEPLNAFVLNCKRQKTEGNCSSENDEGSPKETSTILKFAGTISQAENISSHLTKITKEEAKDIISKNHKPNITSKNRAETRQNAHNDRFKIVNCTRSLNADLDESKNVTIVDVEKDVSNTSSTSTNKTISEEETDKFVYDLYMADDNESNIQCPDNIDDLSVAACDYQLYNEHRGQNDKDFDSDDSEDSNDENNWRNDYPDEDDDCYDDNDSVDEDDMRRAINDVDLDGDRELSSDEENANQFVFSVDSDGIETEDVIDVCDVNRYGLAYARYKARVLNQFKKPTATIEEFDSGAEEEKSSGDDDNDDGDDDDSENLDLYD